jgi:hypothetical protein
VELEVLEEEVEDGKHQVVQYQDLQTPEVVVVDHLIPMLVREVDQVL